MGLLYDNSPIHYALAVSKPIKQPLTIRKAPLATNLPPRHAYHIRSSMHETLLSNSMN